MAKNKDTHAEREEIANIQSQFHMNLDDAIHKIATVVAGGGSAHSSHAPSGFVDPNAARQERQLAAGILKPTGPMAEKINWSELGMKLAPGAFKKTASATNNVNAAEELRQMFGSGGGGGNGQRAPMPQNTLTLNLQNRVAERFSAVIAELSKFKFAASEETRREQMAEVVSGVKAALKKLALKNVVSNTKELYDNGDQKVLAENFFQTNKGMRVVFKLANVNMKVSVSVDGDFNGDEFIALEQDGGEVGAFVVRQTEGGLEDLSDKFALKMDQVS